MQDIVNAIEEKLTDLLEDHIKDSFGSRGISERVEEYVEKVVTESDSNNALDDIFCEQIKVCIQEYLDDPRTSTVLDLNKDGLINILDERVREILLREFNMKPNEPKAYAIFKGGSVVRFKDGSETVALNILDAFNVFQQDNAVSITKAKS